jgi:hypothetical protein
MSAAQVPKTRTWLIVLVLVSLTLLLFIGANAHLLYIAVQSEPACVQHAKTGHSLPNTFAAAASAC